MKLLQRTNRVYLLFTAALLLVAGVALYVIITDVINEEVTEKLAVDLERVVSVAEAHGAVMELPPVMVLDTLPMGTPPSDASVRNVELLDPLEGDEELFREVSAVRTINGMPYRITLRATILQPHDYLYSIGLALFFASLLVLAGLWWVNQRVAHTIWGAFHRNLDALQQFDLRKDDTLTLEPSHIAEFAQLNDAVTKLTERIRADHRALKEFTGNASHEMSTPLAAVQVKLETALSAPGLDESTARSLNDAYEQVLRLSRLHQGLLLLSRIENRQFATTQGINVSRAVDAELERYAERIASKSITVERTMDRDFLVEAHPHLLETLLANIIGNAIKHHQGEGAIKVQLQDRILTISNPAPPLNIPAQELFQRFKKADQTSASPGLGLSIAQAICEISGWRITYTSEEGHHTIAIAF